MFRIVSSAISKLAKLAATSVDLSADDLLQIDDATTVQGRHAIFGESTSEARQRGGSAQGD